MPRFTAAPRFKKIPDWKAFLNNFAHYKLTGEVPYNFGRDEPLRIDNLYHVHFGTADATLTRWSRIPADRQNLRTIKLGEEDFWLLYAFDDIKDEYVLISIMGPEAHSHEKWSAYLYTINHEIIKPWIEGRLAFDDDDEAPTCPVR